MYTDSTSLASPLSVIMPVTIFQGRWEVCEFNYVCVCENALYQNMRSLISYSGSSLSFLFFFFFLVEEKQVRLKLFVIALSFTCT